MQKIKEKAQAETALESVSKNCICYSLNNSCMASELCYTFNNSYMALVIFWLYTCALMRNSCISNYIGIIGSIKKREENEQELSFEILQCQARKAKAEAEAAEIQ